MWGLVRLWGKVIKHATGYRAQNAEVAALVGSTLVDVERIADLYGVPVISEEEWFGSGERAIDAEM